ncbi:hypothetical protein ACFCZY_40110, partial [Streptomyces sp. NPDC056237]|uniref:hypothetical protein n=1 Tax=Streptomyces sp. NPDC056237 TaxID=3345758 RepID=UPI0035DBED15
MTNAFAMLRLLPMSDREKDVEILALRHQIAVLERHLDGQRVRFDAGDRAFLASLLHGVPREVLRRMRLLVRPDTLLRWPDRPPARRPVPAQARRPAEHRALDPRAGPAPGQGESQLGATGGCMANYSSRSRGDLDGDPVSGQLLGCFLGPVGLLVIDAGQHQGVLGHDGPVGGLQAHVGDVDLGAGQPRRFTWVRRLGGGAPMGLVKVVRSVSGVSSPGTLAGMSDGAP